MHMSFWWNCDIGDFLFKGFVVKTVGGLIATCLGVASLAFLFEWLKYLQAKQRQKEIMLRSKQLQMICSSESATLLTSEASIDPRNPLNITVFDRALLFGAELSLWFLLQNLGYMIMLAVMLYNGWLFISGILGGGLGYFIFGQMFMKINLQNCQIMRDTFCMQICEEPDSVPSNGDGESTPALQIPTSSRELSSCHNEITVSVHAERDT